LLKIGWCQFAVLADMAKHLWLTAKWLGFALLAGYLAWRMIALGLAEYYAGLDDQTALAWYPYQADALRRRAGALSKTEPAAAELLVRQALQANPVNAQGYSLLATLREGRGDTAGAAAMITLASRLAPMAGRVQLQAADFWLRQGQLGLALERLSVALQLRSDLRPSLYPILLRFAEDTRTRPAFAPLLARPPDWWESFFQYVAAQAASLETVQALYQQQQQGGAPPTAGQRSAYLARLQQANQWQELYFAWLDGFDRQQLNRLGYLYNGDFELPLTQEGFDWRAPAVAGVRVEAAPTYGATGSRALRVVFQGQRVPFAPLYQYLLLAPGGYRLQGRVRPENLRAERGVQWTVQCVGNSKLLGDSERFLGSDQWRGFTADFRVPVRDCPVQVLRLVLVGQAVLDFEAQGTVWFDDLVIERLD
jgi:hypothetical protein